MELLLVCLLPFKKYLKYYCDPFNLGRVLRLVAAYFRLKVLTVLATTSKHYSINLKINVSNISAIDLLNQTNQSLSKSLRTDEERFNGKEH